jgi:glycosyltransferase involved in cell wall biosynthesis
VNFLAGDFIERHARAASDHFPVKVLFVVKDNSMPPGKIRMDHVHDSENFQTFIFYYASYANIKLFEKLTSVWLQAKCLSKGFQIIVSKYGLPSLIHSHVLLKHAWFALKKAKQYALPLLISEQWTGYLQEAEGEFNSLTSFQKRTISNALRYAVHVTTVSDYLAQQLRKRFAFRDYTVIPNLVDMSIFKPVENNDAITTFVHISTLSPQKNFDEILQACVLLKALAASFRLKVFSPAKPAYAQKVNELGLSGAVVFKEEIPQPELAKEVAASDALILYSNYETFGCVIVEANACGVPVIASDFPVFGENVKEGVTGFKVPLHHPEELAACMVKFINRQASFNKEQVISITKTHYSFDVVGKRFADVYQRCAKP